MTAKKLKRSEKYALGSAALGAVIGLVAGHFGGFWVGFIVGVFSAAGLYQAILKQTALERAVDGELLDR